MKAYRVWATWKDRPEKAFEASGAYERRERAEGVAFVFTRDHQSSFPKNTFNGVLCHFVVREEEVPRSFVFKGQPDQVVMMILGDDDVQTNVVTGEREIERILPLGRSV